MNSDSIFKELSSDLLITKAIDCIERDFQEYPLFYNPSSVPLLSSKTIINSVKNKINLYYCPSCGESFSIPYDFISDRTAVTIPVEDLIIRYLLRLTLEKHTKHVLNSPDDLEQTLAEIGLKAETQALNIFKIDIASYYDSIDHSILIKCISEILNIDIDHDYCRFLSTCLKVVYRNCDGEITRKEVGLTIGLKPDEYFADLFMDYITNRIKISLGKDIFYIADEIIFFSKSLNEARKTFKSIENLLLDFGLRINKSKNNAISLSLDELEIRKELILQDNLQELLDGSYFGKFMLEQQGTSYSYEISEERYNSNLQVISNNYPILEKETIQQEIFSYDDSIKFLKSLIDNKRNIQQYQRKHPTYSKFYNITFSQPNDFLLDFENLDFSIFQIDTLRKLLKVIYQFPRSEYYSYIAIDVLVYVATNSIHSVNYYIDKLENTNDVPRLAAKLTIACDFSNLSIIEMLKSENIHDYQKYLLLRRLYKNRQNLDYSFDNYKVDQVTFHSGGQGKSPYLHYIDNVKSLVKLLGSSSNHYALKTLCEYLIML